MMKQSRVSLMISDTKIILSLLGFFDVDRCSIRSSIADRMGHKGLAQPTFTNGTLVSPLDFLYELFAYLRIPTLKLLAHSHWSSTSLSPHLTIDAKTTTDMAGRNSFKVSFKCLCAISGLTEVDLLVCTLRSQIALADLMSYKRLAARPGFTRNTVQERRTR